MNTIKKYLEERPGTIFGLVAGVVVAAAMLNSAKSLEPMDYYLIELPNTAPGMVFDGLPAKIYQGNLYRLDHNGFLVKEEMTRDIEEGRFLVTFQDNQFSNQILEIQPNGETKMWRKVYNLGAGEVSFGVSTYGDPNDPASRAQAEEKWENTKRRVKFSETYPDGPRLQFSALIPSTEAFIHSQLLGEAYEKGITFPTRATDIAEPSPSPSIGIYKKKIPIERRRQSALPWLY